MEEGGKGVWEKKENEAEDGRNQGWKMGEDWGKGWGVGVRR